MSIVIESLFRWRHSLEFETVFLEWIFEENHTPVLIRNIERTRFSYVQKHLLILGLS